MLAFFNDGLDYYESITNIPARGEVLFEKFPSEEELSVAFPNYLIKKAEQVALTASILRSNAYREESDPLFFKWQRGEATEQEWLDKVNEIKARFPKE